MGFLNQPTGSGGGARFKTPQSGSRVHIFTALHRESTAQVYSLDYQCLAHGQAQRISTPYI